MSEITTPPRLGQDILDTAVNRRLLLVPENPDLTLEKTGSDPSENKILKNKTGSEIGPGFRPYQITVTTKFIISNWKEYQP